MQYQYTGNASGSTRSEIISLSVSLLHSRWLPNLLHGIEKEPRVLVRIICGAVLDALEHMRHRPILLLAVVHV